MRKGKGKKEYHIIIEKDEDNYFVADVAQLPGCHTQAKSLDVLMKRITEVIQLYLEVKQGPLTKCEFIGVQRLAV